MAAVALLSLTFLELSTRLTQLAYSAALLAVVLLFAWFVLPQQKSTVRLIGTVCSLAAIVSSGMAIYASW